VAKVLKLMSGWRRRLVTEPHRLSSAQKDIETHQREGYTLLDELEYVGVHILLFEKPVEEAKK
jgi:hypothetical protein